MASFPNTPVSRTTFFGPCNILQNSATLATFFLFVFCVFEALELVYGVGAALFFKVKTKCPDGLIFQVCNVAWGAVISVETFKY